MENMRTLVFVDISTTGLQDPDITEICMIACSRTDLLQYPNSIPRALQKIDLKFRPRKTFDIRAEEKSRLNAEMLQEFPYFSKTEAKLINAFLDRLVKPACLIAHDGIQFDFIHLDRHFKSVGEEFAENFKRIDSLHIFRRIDKENRSYSLENVCDRLVMIAFEDSPCLNSAEDKAFALLTCASAYCQQFIAEIDKLK